MTAQRVTGSSVAPPVSLGAVGTGAPTATADSSGTAVFALLGTDGAGSGGDESFRPARHRGRRSVAASSVTRCRSRPARASTSSCAGPGQLGVLEAHHRHGGVAHPGRRLLGPRWRRATSPPAVATLGTTKYVLVRGGSTARSTNKSSTTTRRRGDPSARFISSNPAAARDVAAPEASRCSPAAAT